MLAFLKGKCRFWMILWHGCRPGCFPQRSPTFYTYYSRAPFNLAFSPPLSFSRQLNGQFNGQPTYNGILALYMILIEAKGCYNMTLVKTYGGRYHSTLPYLTPELEEKSD